MSKLSVISVRFKRYLRSFKSTFKQVDDMSKKLSILDYYMDFEENNVLIYYKGPFMESILAKITEDIKIRFDDDPITSKKVFSIFIELAQNIAHHSSERNIYTDQLKRAGNGTFQISEADTHFTLVAGNLIRNESVPEIIDKCNIINELDIDGLRKLKRDLRNLPRREGHKGANIGLVDIVLKAQNPLQVEVAPINSEYSYFIISIDVSKSNKTD
jgi:Family of unknown function (DUF6272)